MKNFYLLAFHVFCVLAINAQLPIVNGWTQFTPSSDSRIIYVSDADGDNGTAVFYSPSSSEVGTDPFNPSSTVLSYQTLAAAMTQVRTGFPDWILLKRGDTFTNQHFGTINLSGRSETEPIFIGSYGNVSTERPLILTGASNLISFTGSSSHIALVGLHALPHTRSGSDEPSAVFILNAPFESFLVEDCYFDQYFMHLVVQDYVNTTIHTHRNFTARRNILTNAYKIGGGGGGVYMHQIDGILFEENMIDHNGWNESIAGANATGFSHNTYFQSSCRNLIFRNNIVSNASAVGIGARCGGTITNNLLFSNPRNLFVGSFDQGQINWPTDAVGGEVAYNVILGARPESFDGGNGITLDRVRDVAVHHNIVAHFTQTANYNIGIGVDHVDDITVRKNIVYKWGNNQSSGPAYASGLSFGTNRLNTSVVDSNDLQMENLQGYCMNFNGSFNQVQLNGNRYHNIASAVNWFANGSYATWLSSSGETNSLQVDVPYLDPERSISTYLTSIGASGTTSDFVQSCKQQRKGNWNVELSAAEVNSYIRIGFGLEESNLSTLNPAGSSIQLFPNPSLDGMIQIISPSNCIAEIYSIDGSCIGNYTIRVGMNSLKIEKTGVYLIHLGSEIRRICIQ